MPCSAFWNRTIVVRTDSSVAEGAGRFPTRRTWERRFESLPARLPGLIGCLGSHLVAPINPFAVQGHAAAIDSTALRAKGGVWHKKHRRQASSPIRRSTPKRTGASPAITAGGTAGSCTWSAQRLRVDSLDRTLDPRQRGRQSAGAQLLATCPPKSATFSATPRITSRRCTKHVKRRTLSDCHPPGPYPHRDGVLKCANSFIGCVRWLLNRSTACSKTSSSGVVKCPSKVSAVSNSLCLVPSCSTNSSYSIRSAPATYRCGCQSLTARRMIYDHVSLRSSHPSSQ